MITFDTYILDNQKKRIYKNINREKETKNTY